MIGAIIFLLQLLSILLAFSLVIFVHELGHFIVGRMNKIGVLVFCLGFGPTLFSYRDKKGTEWKVSAIPLGGYVKFEGDENPASVNLSNEVTKKDNSSSSFVHASIFGRLSTVAAGPVANFLFSIVTFSIIILVNGVASNAPIVGQVNEFYKEKHDLRPGDKILKVGNRGITNFEDIFKEVSKTNNSLNSFLIEREGLKKEIILPYIFQPVVKGIEPLSAAARSNLKVGDVFLTVNGEILHRFTDLKDFVINSKGRELKVTIFRENREIQKIIKPTLTPFEEIDGTFSEKYRIGVLGGPIFEAERNTPMLFEAFVMGTNATLSVFSGTIRGIKGMILGEVDPKHLSGPIGVAHAVSDSIKSGFVSFFTLIAIISTGIGIVNLLPIPILDGGHIVLLSYEAITKKKPSDKFLRFAMIAGLFLILSLIMFTTLNDVLRVIL